MSDVSARMLAGTLRRLQALSLEGASALTRDGLWQMMAMMNAK